MDQKGINDAMENIKKNNNLNVKEKEGHGKKAEDVEPGLDLFGKTVIITGGYAGIGYETARAFALKNAKVIIIGRDPVRGNKAAEDLIKDTKNGRIEFEQMDLESFESIRKFAEKYNARNIPLNYLINNAGVMATPFGRTKDGLETQIGTNHFGHFLLTHLLLPRLLSGAPSRVINVSSAGHVMCGIREDYNWEKEPYHTFQAYGQSKTANILFSLELTRRFKEKGLISNSLHPGVIFTGLVKHMTEDSMKEAFKDPELVKKFEKYSSSLKTPQQGAATTLFASLSPSDGAKFYDDCEETEAAAHAQDPEAAKKLWILSEKVVGGPINNY